jgi:hypothetical protein
MKFKIQHDAVFNKKDFCLDSSTDHRLDRQTAWNHQWALLGKSDGPQSVFLMGSRVAGTTALLMDPRFGLPMASATEALTAQRVEPPIRIFAWIAGRIVAWIGKALETANEKCLEQLMDPQSVFLMGSRIAGMMALFILDNSLNGFMAPHRSRNRSQ